MLQVMAYTGGKSVPSARFRVRQYISELRRLGIDMRELPARFGSYPPALRALRPGWGVLSVAERFGAAIGHRTAGVTLLQREMLSTFATVERFTKAPRVLDVDDAIWLLRGGQFAASIARLCHTAICGNAFIADFFRGRTQHVTVLPTPVDTERFRPPGMPRTGDGGIICWSGTSSGFPFLLAIENALASVLNAGANRRLRIVADAKPSFRSIPVHKVDFVPWSEDVEVAAIQSADVGIMPLPDSPWARGKCSYKLLAYMSCGIPVVATPIGMNAEVLSKGNVGLAASTDGEWADALEFLLNRPAEGSAMGCAGREVVVREYSLNELAPKLAAVLLRAAAGRN